MPRVVTFGEVMLRLSPPGKERFAQAHSFEASYGGAEANVAVALAQWGVNARLLTSLPSGGIGDACLKALRAWALDTSFVHRAPGRMGIYFLEQGAAQRSSQVVYDRAGSVFSQAKPGDFAWDAALGGSDWFHFTGITPALSLNAQAHIQEAVDAARSLGLRVSCDVNYRKKLWSAEQARETLSSLVQGIDLLIANEEDAEAVFGIRAEGSEVQAGVIDHARYFSVAEQLASRLEARAVAITLRESHSASQNGWSGLLYTNGNAHLSRRYKIDVVDRIGSGDAFAAGLVMGYLEGWTGQDTVEFAAAAGCLAHSVPGDFGVFTRDEVEALVRVGGSGRVQR